MAVIEVPLKLDGDSARAMWALTTALEGATAAMAELTQVLKAKPND